MVFKMVSGRMFGNAMLRDAMANPIFALASYSSIVNIISFPLSL